MEFSTEETSSILKFYSVQKNRLVGELKHVDQMLRKLKGERAKTKKRECY